VGHDKSGKLVDLGLCQGADCTEHVEDPGILVELQ
jgi:hypothetical protein